MNEQDEIYTINYLLGANQARLTTSQILERISYVKNNHDKPYDRNQ
ncbi:MAG: hypothetical protein AB8G05_17850 [Oligoflexales bacterium]